MISTKVVRVNSVNPQQTRHIVTMFIQRWPTVCDAGPTLNKHCLNVSCLLCCMGYCILALVMVSTVTQQLDQMYY